jgi:hypothetical protein
MPKKIEWGGVFETRSGETVEIPSYMAVINKNTIKVRTSDFRGSHVTTIKRTDVYRGSMGSGWAEIGGIGGDWRMIQNLSE